jgi:predicted phage-related endonuclease
MSDEQRTEDWRAARAGKLTASRFVDVLGTKAARAKYMREIVFERAAGIAKHEVSSKSLAWGTDVEPFLIEAYELQTGLIVKRSGFLLHPLYPFIGASPDGLVGTDGGIEGKSPHDEAVHIGTWLDGMPSEHYPQVQGNMAVTGRAWWDFISYDPRQAEPFRLYVQRVPRDDAYIARLFGELHQFNEEAEALLAQLRRKAARPFPGRRRPALPSSLLPTFRPVPRKRRPFSSFTTRRPRWHSS